jgi:hypothetical protein
MNDEQAATIRSIKAHYGIDVNKDGRPDFVDFKDAYNPRDTTQYRVPSYVYVRVSVYDESLLPALRKGLFQYINNNAYIQELFSIDRQQKAELLAEIDREIGKIDSLQHVRIRKEAKTENGQLVFFGNEPEVKLFYPDILRLYDQKQSLEKSIKISDEIIVVVQDFTSLQQEENSLMLSIVFFGALMAAVGLICALLWQYRKRIYILIREDSSRSSSVF